MNAATGAVVSTVGLLKKISVKTVYGNIKRDALTATPTPVMRVLGRVTGLHKVQTPYGEQMGLKGEFIAVNTSQDKFRSNTCYLPGIAQDMITAAFNDKPLEFGFEIGVVTSAKPIGYEYTVQTLVQIADSDPMQALINKLASGAPALPAPAPASVTPQVAQERPSERAMRQASEANAKTQAKAKGVKA